MSYMELTKRHNEESPSQQELDTTHDQLTSTRQEREAA